MKYIGYLDPDGYDRLVIRGDVNTREFIAFWLRDGHVLAAMNVNTWNVTEPIEQMIRSRQRVELTRLRTRALPLAQVAVG